MTIVAIEDNRNVEWAKGNKGSMLLQKMGWKEGDGIGKRTNKNTTALRALKRKESLGLGASIQTEGGNSETTGHFASVLENLKAAHAKTSKSTGKLSEKKNAKLTLAQNRCNAGRKKIRESKFSEMSPDDMAAVFGNRDFKPVVTDMESTGSPENSIKKESKKRRKRDSEKTSKLEKKRKTSNTVEGSSSSLSPMR
jgi:G-patch domain